MELGCTTIGRWTFLHKFSEDGVGAMQRETCVVRVNVRKSCGCYSHLCRQKLPLSLEGGGGGGGGGAKGHWLIGKSKEHIFTKIQPCLARVVS